MANVSRHWWCKRYIRRGTVGLCLAIAVGAVAACNSVLNGQDQNRGNLPDVFDVVRAVDLTPQAPQGSATGHIGDGRPPRPQSYFGEATPSAVRNNASAAAPATPNGDGYDLNFDNAPVTTVAKVILVDILNLGYTIDPRVQGTVSLASGQPVPRADLLFVLENALRVSNIAMIKDRSGYRLIPLADAVGSGGVDVVTRGGQPEPGYGVTVVPLHYVSMAAAVKLFDSFTTKPGMVRGDPGRNILLIQGTASERAAAVETVLAFDVDWMRGQSVGIYPVRNAVPEPLISEVEKIMGAGEGGPAQTLVRFQPVNRLNAILVVTSRPELLRTAATWIARLDKTDLASSAVKVYRVRYGSAKVLANLLNDIFTGRQGSESESATNQLAPGGGAALSSNSALGSGGLGAGGFGSGGASPLGAGQRQPPAQTRVGETGIGTAGTLPGAAGSTPGSSIFGQSGSTGAGGSGGPGILPGVRITADVTNNALLIYANHENYRIIEQTLQQLDRPQMQVAIDATIAEVTLNDTLAYGVQYFLQNYSGSLALLNAGAPVTNAATALPTSAAGAAGTVVANTLISRVVPGFNFLVGSEANPRVILNALRSVSDVKVLSAPSLVVLDNQVATLQVGDQIPIQTQSATAVTAAGAPVVSNVDYRSTGVILRVVPRINVNGNVMLDVEQEISSPSANINTLTPTISQRKVKSSIAVASGQTVLLAGLISQNQSRVRSGIPILESLDWIGDVFSNNSTNSQRTELIIFIRPQIIRDGVDARRVAEELRSRLRGTIESSRRPLIQLPNSRAAPVVQQ